MNGKEKRNLFDDECLSEGGKLCSFGRQGQSSRRTSERMEREEKGRKIEVVKIKERKGHA